MGEGLFGGGGDLVSGGEGLAVGYVLGDGAGEDDGFLGYYSDLVS